MGILSKLFGTNRKEWKEYNTPKITRTRVMAAGYKTDEGVQKGEIEKYKAESKARGKERRILERARQGLLKERQRRTGIGGGQWKAMGGKVMGMPSFVQKAVEGTKFQRVISRNVDERSTRYNLPGGVSYRVRKPQSQSQGKGVGRPRMSYKHIDPRTGRFIPATVYYKVIRGLRRQQESAAERFARMQEARQMARTTPQMQNSQIPTTNQQQMPPQMPQVQRFPPRQYPNTTQQFQQRERFMQQRPMRPPVLPGQNEIIMTPQGPMRVVTDLMTSKQRLIPARQVIF